MDELPGTYKNFPSQETEGLTYARSKMRTEKQKAASRLNGAKSQGPLTAMGKDRIRTKALKHGMTARLALWPNEDPAQFHALFVTLLEQMAPENDLEFLCVEEMTLAKWRQRRVMTAETQAGLRVAKGEDDAGKTTLEAYQACEAAGEFLSTLRRHEAAFGRAYQRAYRHLLQLRQGREPKG